MAGQVCIVAIPNGEIRAIEHMLMPRKVFFCMAEIDQSSLLMT